MAVSVHALRSGALSLPTFTLIATDDRESMITCPSNSFLIQKPIDNGSFVRFVFDLGLRRNLDDYPAGIAETLRKSGPVETVPCVVDSLAQGGLKPDDIHYVILSHTHLDHIGTPSHFPNTQFIVGPGTYDICNGNTKLKGPLHFFDDKNMLDEKMTIELPTTGGHDERVARFQALSRHGLALSDWKAVGPFEKALDVFGDGSLSILSLPGHVPGHLGLLAKVALDPPGYVLLMGDAVHHPGLLDGSEKMGEWYEPSCSSVICMHSDRKSAEKTIGWLREVRRDGLDGGQVEAILAHDTAWSAGAGNDHKFWPGHI